MTMSQTPRRNIPFGRPMIGDVERELAAEVLKGTILTHGPRCAEFEEKFAARIGVRHALTVSSCTTGLQLALMALGLKAGDEILVPAQTHVATAHVVEHLGGKPVFVDVERATGNIDPQRAAQVITPRTRAIMPVHYLGLPCDMEALTALAKQHNLSVVEDCALALGADYAGCHPGRLGNVGAFSFYPAKHITTLEGGMVTTDDDQLATQLRHLRAFGYDRGLNERKVPGIYDVVSLGHNFRMSEIQAAVGIGQLGQLEQFLVARRRNTDILLEGVRSIDEISTFPVHHGKARSACYCVNIVLRPDSRIDRNALIFQLNEAGVGTSVHYPIPVPLSGYYRSKYGYRDSDFPVAKWISDRAISLPVGPHLSADDMTFIVDSVKHSISELS
jgi:perosamine synthetase